MTWRALAWHEARQSYEARSIRMLLGLVIFVCVIGAYVYPLVAPEPYTTAHFGGFITEALSVVVPLLGLVIGYNAIVTERSSGALLLTLALPYGRDDVTLGKLLGRGSVVAGGIVVGLLIAAGLVVYPYGSLSILPFVGFVGLAIALGLAYTGIGVAVSLMTASKQRATVAAFVIYFVFALLWSDLATFVEAALTAADVVNEMPGALTFIFASDPGSAFGRAVAGFVDPSAAIDDAWYMNRWIALATLLAWIVVPIGIAYRRFAGADL